jgi:hypothetical protein
MPVEDTGLIFPKSNITVEQPEGAESVEFDDGRGLNAKDMVDLGEPTTVDHSDLHTPRSTDQFETPGPVSVVLDGYDLKGETSSAQVKVVEPKPRSRGKGTSSAETK